MGRTWRDDVRELEKLLGECEHYIDCFLDKVNIVMDEIVEEVKKQLGYDDIIMFNIKQLANTYFNLFDAKEIVNKLKDRIIMGLLERE